MSQTPEQPNTSVYSRENLLSLYLPSFILSLGAGIALPAVPVFARQFDVSLSESSLVFVVYMIGGALAPIPMGILMDRIGRRKIALAAPFLVAIFSCLVAVAQSWPELLVYRFLSGFALQTWSLARLAIIADTGGDKQRGRQITSMVGIEMTGRLMGPAVGGFIAAATDVRVPFVIYGIISLIAAIPSFRLLKESAPGMVARKAGEVGVPPSRGTLAALLTFPVLVFFLAQFLASVTRGTLTTGAIHLFTVEVYGVGADVIGLIATGAAIFGVPIVFSTGAIMDRFGRKMTVVPGFYLLSAALFVMMVVASLGLPIEMYVLAFVAMQMSMNVTSGNMQVLGSDIAPAHIRGKFFGIWRMIGEVGMALSPWGFALLADLWGFSASFTMLALCAFLCATVLAFFVQDPLKRKQALLDAAVAADAEAQAAKAPSPAAAAR